MIESGNTYMGYNIPTTEFLAGRRAQLERAFAIAQREGVRAND